MTDNDNMAQIADEAALRRLIMKYARCCDTRDGKGFAALYTPDAVLEGPGFRNDTQAGIAAVPESLNVFFKTYHTLMNTLFEISGDGATGVIYSMAHHLTPLSDGAYNDLVMHITYHDQYARVGGEWKFKRRRVDMAFTENRTVKNIGKMPEL